MEMDPKPAELITLPMSMACHEHGYSQVVIGLKGRVEFDIHGFGNRIGPGFGCVVSAYTNHAFGGAFGQSDILVLNLPKPNADDPVALQKLNQLDQQDIYFKLSNQLQQIIGLLAREIQLDPSDLLLQRACQDTLISLLKKHISAFQFSRRDARLDLDAIDKYIEENLTRRISVMQLAGSVFLGESQFFSLFKEKMGITPHQYVLRKRVDIARKMIESGRYNMSQISDLTGFSSQSSFAHTFSRIQGISPSNYRRQLF